MKNLKIVFASLLLAVMGVVGFSSFTTAPKKSFSLVERSVSGGVWTTATPSGCGGTAQICGYTFDDENDLTTEEVEGNLPDPAAVVINPDIDYNGTTVHFLLKAAN